MSTGRNLFIALTSSVLAVGFYAYCAERPHTQGVRSQATTTPSREVRTEQSPVYPQVQPARPVATELAEPDRERELASNPLTRVADMGHTDAIEEREMLVATLMGSGSVTGEWGHKGMERVNDVVTYVHQDGLANAESLGCWGAGCGVRLTYLRNDTRDMERLADPLSRGGWQHGVVITAPVAKDGEALVSYVFFLSPSES